MNSRLAVLFIAAAMPVAAGAQVQPKCLAAPPGELLVRTSDGRVLRQGNTPGAMPLAGVSDALAVAAYHKDWWLVLRRDGSVLEILKQGAPRVVPGIEKAVDIALGENHAAVLLADGTVRTWGDKTGGIPGDNTCPVRPCEAGSFNKHDADWIERNPNCACPPRTPGKPTNWSAALSTVNLENAASLAAGRYWTFAVLRDGGLRAWGTDYHRSIEGMLGADARKFALRPVPVPAAQKATVAWSGNGVNAARMADGSWKVWGVGVDKMPTDAPALKGAVAVTDFFALFPDGSVRQWRGAKPSALVRQRAVAITADVGVDVQTHSALLDDGQVLLWGPDRIFPNGPVSVMKVDAETVRQCSALR